LVARNNVPATKMMFLQPDLRIKETGKKKDTAKSLSEKELQSWKNGGGHSPVANSQFLRSKWGTWDTYAAATKLTLSTIVWDCSVRKSTPENGNGTNFENCLSIAVNM
jgi:hypothetical protein